MAPILYGNLPKESTIEAYVKAAFFILFAGALVMPHPMGWLALAFGFCLIFYAGYISAGGVDVGR